VVEVISEIYQIFVVSIALDHFVDQMRQQNRAIRVFGEMIRPSIIYKFLSALLRFFIRILIEGSLEKRDTQTVEINFSWILFLIFTFDLG